MRRLVIDDRRNFAFDHEVARTAQDGIALLEAHAKDWIDELYLDHDLGVLFADGAPVEDAQGNLVFDDIWPVIRHMEECAEYTGMPYDIGTIYIVSDNPSGALRMKQALNRYYDDVRHVDAGPMLDKSRAMEPTQLEMLLRSRRESVDVPHDA